MSVSLELSCQRMRKQLKKISIFCKRKIAFSQRIPFWAVGATAPQISLSLGVKMEIEFLWVIVEFSTCAGEFKGKDSQMKVNSREKASGSAKDMHCMKCMHALHALHDYMSCTV